MENNFKFYKVTSIQEFPDNGRLFIEITNLSIVIYSLNGEYFATGDVCSHDNGPVGEGKIEGYEIICPRHGARFDIHNGKVTRYPAASDIPSYPIKIEGDTLFIGIPAN
ncbi:MAG: Rieske (2Fe-2S) protein [Anaerolineaceae bacterium]